MTGVVGLVCYLAMLWRVGRNCRRTWLDADATPGERAFAIGAAAATAAVLVHSLFVNTLLMPFVMEQLWLLWGLTFVIRTRRAAA